MALPASALSRWQALPFPAKLAVGFLGFMAVIWLRDSLGAASVLLALLLWGAVVIGVVYAGGGLAWADRYPQLARLLQAFAPRVAFRPMADVRAGMSGAGPVGPAREPPPAASNPPKPTTAAPDLSRFVGLEAVFDEIQRLVATRASWASTVAPATLVLLVGPRGTGKTSVALTLAAELQRVGSLRSTKIVDLSVSEVPGLRSAYGPSEAGLTAVKDRIQTALDGALLIDDLDGLIGAADGATAAEIGTRLLSVARQHPGRLFVIATGSKTAASRLDPANRWLGQLNVRRIEFQDLSASALERLFTQLLGQRNLRLASDAGRALKIQIEERRAQAGDEFDNAYAIGRLVDDVAQSQALRVHDTASLPNEAKRIVTSDDIRNATPAL